MKYGVKILTLILLAILIVPSIGFTNNKESCAGTCPVPNIQINIQPEIKPEAKPEIPAIEVPVICVNRHPRSHIYNVNGVTRWHLLNYRQRRVAKAILPPYGDRCLGVRCIECGH